MLLFLPLSQPALQTRARYGSVLDPLCSWPADCTLHHFTPTLLCYCQSEDLLPFSCDVSHNFSNQMPPLLCGCTRTHVQIDKFHSTLKYRHIPNVRLSTSFQSRGHWCPCSCFVQVHFRWILWDEEHILLPSMKQEMYWYNWYKKCFYMTELETGKSLKSRLGESVKSAVGWLRIG